MGRKRPRQNADRREAKKICSTAKTGSKTDFDYIAEDDYVVLGDFMYVRPYVFEFRMNFKPRWRNSTVYDVFCREFMHTDKEYWAKEVEEGRVLLRGKPVAKDLVWNDGMEVVHLVHRHESAVLSLPVHIAKDDPKFVVVSKPPSLPIHPCGTYRRNSLLFILRAFYNMGKLLAVHRLDKETSGLVILAKDAASAAEFSADIKEHKVQKTYVAEVYGSFPAGTTECTQAILWDKREMKGSVSSEGMEAKSVFRRISFESKRRTSFVECKPITGRTHQLRIHLAHLGHGIVNDPLYGNGNLQADCMPALQSKENPLSITLTHPKFCNDTAVNARRQTHLASAWAQDSYRRNGRHLSCAEEGKILSCTNCPQVANVKNVELHKMYIHLHAMKYESQSWKFEVPPPPWMSNETNTNDSNKPVATKKERSCTMS